jgi:hypothetical protein
MLVATALAGGFGKVAGDGSRQIWKGLCRNLSFQLRDAYLRVLFGFLASEGNWNLVLSETTALPLHDRMIIALRFLDDSSLLTYISKWTQKMERQGRIDGILLTGWTKEGIDMMEAYVDKTGDVQSAALLLSALPCISDKRITNWIESYSDLLDQWELYDKRVLFDIERSKVNPNKEKIPAQLFLRCNFCNQTISQGFKPKKMGFIPSNVTPSKSKYTTCPTCQKSLPRCSICLLPMGSHLENQENGLHGIAQFDVGNSSKFDQWFTWCLQCHHGGHAGHIFEWFKSNSRCPVSNCNCTCQKTK